VCGRAGTPFRSARAVARDLDHMIGRHGMAPGDEVPKLMHAAPAPVEGCDRCGTLWRAATARWSSMTDAYRDDRYTDAQIARLQADEIRSTEADARWMQEQGVVAGARLVEVGCYMGGFLTFTARRGAHAIGIDPNPQLVDACHRQGLDARAGTLECAELPAASFDSVWILNCFDQVAAPDGLLVAAHRILRAGGRLVIRTPNAAFVRAAYADADPRLASAARRQLLWGLPHLCCYTVAALASLVRTHGFDVESVRGRPNGECRTVVALAGPPWFDLVARKIDALRTRRTPVPRG
jgi:SAM-dependent methyltransferase